MNKHLWNATAYILFFALGCVDAPPDPAPDAERNAYCGVTARSDLDAWVGEVVTLCRASSHGDEAPSCSAGRVVSGSIVPLAWASELGAIRVLPAADGRYVALLADERLVMTRGDGSIERELAAWAGDPWVSEDGQRVVWVGLADGFTSWDFGVPTVIVAQDMSETVPTVLIDDPWASTPRPIPGSRDIVYVSTEGGVASLWIGGPERAPARLTNAGLTSMGPEFVPVPDRELVWRDGVLFYGARDESGASRIWRFSLADGASRVLGPGAWPRLHSSGSLLARQETGDCAVSYPERETP